ncbi:hypothetical protein GJ496_006148 [Pomphorhynchus laevis]|nr:hypothetical protein GJ496_006148 [Pomphorhynchus laevis]
MFFHKHCHRLDIYSVLQMDGRELNVSTIKLHLIHDHHLRYHLSYGDDSAPVCSTHERNVEHNRPSDIRDESSSLNRRSRFRIRKTSQALMIWKLYYQQGPVIALE